ncbi:MAG: hypothetical protein KF863_10690 [Rubrivivax sp.]|nr:hypothetical protein [Rubrivivax sp.]
MSDKRKPGRPPEAGEARTMEIKARATPAEHAQYVALGGAEWLRRALKRAYARLTREGKPPA